MTRVLVVWEDAYFETLGVMVRRLVRASAPAGSSEAAHVLFHTARGNGSFERYVHSTWPQVRAKGLLARSGRHRPPDLCRRWRSCA